MFGGIELVFHCRRNIPLSLARQGLILHTIKALTIVLWRVRDCSGNHFLVQSFMHSRLSDGLDVIWGLLPCATVVVARRGP